LCLIFASNLQEIEEVGCSRMNSDEIFVGLRDRIREVCDAKFRLGLEVVVSAGAQDG
jgi:hypothetical protein